MIGITQYSFETRDNSEKIHVRCLACNWEGDYETPFEHKASLASTLSRAAHVLLTHRNDDNCDVPIEGNRGPINLKDLVPPSARDGRPGNRP